MNNQLSPRFEEQVRAAMDVAPARAEFVESLAHRLAQTRSQSGQNQTWVWRPLRAISIALLIVIVSAILIIGPQRVLAQVLDWLGYVPGLGFVDQEGGLRVLEAPVSQTRDGITVTIQDGLMDANNTWLTFSFEGIRQEQKPLTEDVPGCAASPEIILADGHTLFLDGGSGGGGPTWMRERLSYPAFPVNVNEAIVRIPCVPEVLPGMGPENWEFAIRFVPAPEDFEVLPVSTLPPAAAAPEEASSHEQQGISLSVDEFVELEDGYLFSGSLSWDISLYSWIEFGGFQLELRDANGNVVPVQEVDNGSFIEVGESFIGWSVRTDRKDILGPVSIWISQLAIQEPSATSEEPVLALTFNGTEQQTWPINKAITVQNRSIEIQDAAFEPRGDGFYNLTLNMRTLPGEVSMIFLRDLDNLSRGIASGGGGKPGGETFTQDIQYDYLPQGEHRFVVDTFYYLLQGPWEVQVTIPGYARVTTTPLPQTCVTQESWRAIQSSQPQQLSLAGRVLLEDRSVPALLPNLMLIPLDGTDPITIGQGSWAAISPDGHKVAYAYEGLRVMDVDTGQTSLLIAEDSSYAMAWSSDGQRLAFIRGGDGVYTINADGSGLQRSPGASADMIGIAGWLPDGERIVVSRVSAGGTLMQILDLSSGETEDLFLIDSLKGGFTHLSPDGTHVVYSAGVFGEFNPGVYVADLDGSNQRLLAEPGDDFMFTSGAWSPDSKQLILNPYDVASYRPEPQHPIVVNVDTCQLSVMEQLLGEVKGWAP